MMMKMLFIVYLMKDVTEHLSNMAGDFEIVGNIFENPDLHEQLGY